MYKAYLSDLKPKGLGGLENAACVTLCNMHTAIRPIEAEVFAVWTSDVTFLIFLWPLGASWNLWGLFLETLGGHLGPRGLVLRDTWKRPCEFL